jgi:hypothetical protein
MADFVNFNKRGVSLPYGCKDLADVLKKCREKRAPFAGDKERFMEAYAQLEHAKAVGDTVTGRLVDLEFHFGRVYGTTALEASLAVIVSDAPCFDVEWHRFIDMDIRASVSAEEGSELERKTRRFFESHDLGIPEGLPNAGEISVFIPGIPITQIFPVDPMPVDAKSLAGLAATYLRDVRGLDDRTELVFAFGEMVRQDSAK